ncbi:hypothetical protein M413DRAFT_283035 [Hebeloma cylindrosporum]|uniref:Uncharacterized protein n=1 Tax=Hebeloma cylindrosporum TaxID=76867 RepID=A0A0C3BJQ8_HEBCY|nr:hypothetical protein M413DRAFT_283035 [Hebeloma cylindrosporum h7]
MVLQLSPLLPAGAHNTFNRLRKITSRIENPFDVFVRNLVSSSTLFIQCLILTLVDHLKGSGSLRIHDNHVGWKSLDFNFGFTATTERFKGHFDWIVPPIPPKSSVGSLGLQSLH